MPISTLSLVLGLSISSGYASDDPLSHQDWGAISVDQTKDLPQQYTTPVNKAGVPWGDFSLNGKKYKIQNVSGSNMACFFNSMGLNAAAQAKLLRENKNNSLVRWMVGNDILSAFHNPEQLSGKVKVAIGYNEYMQARDEIDKLEEKRNSLLKENGGNTDVLPEELQKAKLVEKENEIFETFKKRCMSSAAFLAYVDTYIDNNEMMAFAPDGGVNHDDIGQNFTAIDAIAYLNNIGVQIYTWADRKKPLVDGNIHLSHQYIPDGATRIARLYYNPYHFQAFVSAVDEEAERQAKAQEELRKQQEAERQAKDQEELRKQQEAERQAKTQEELRKQQEAERQAKDQEELRKQQEVERQAKAQEELRKQQEAERQAKDQQQGTGELESIGSSQPQVGDVRTNNAKKERWNGSRWVRM
ncbi:MAG: cell envelope integrity protein TolA [Candidatus Paracaedibacteraceae bacterium]|nr:cell envelope integrity protein TolA [Candidatus Paracaedibacteraceae bacterium]